MASRRGSTDAFSLFAFQDIITSVTGIMLLITLLFSLELTRKKVPTADLDESTTSETTEKNIRELEESITSLLSVSDKNQAFMEKAASLPASEIASLEKTLRERLAALQALEAEISSSTRQLDLETSRQSEMIGEMRTKTLSSLETEIKRLQEEIQTTSQSARVVYNPDPGATKSAWLIDLGEERIQVFPMDGGPMRTFQVTLGDQIPPTFQDWVKQRDSNQEYFVLLLRPEAIMLYDKVYPFLDNSGFELGVDLIDSTTDASVTFSGPSK